MEHDHQIPALAIVLDSVRQQLPQSRLRARRQGVPSHAVLWLESWTSDDRGDSLLPPFAEYVVDQLIVTVLARYILDHVGKQPLEFISVPLFGLM